MTEYPHLFTPLTIRGRTIPNRIVSTPHATGWELPGGLISDKEVDYHVRKAAGGVGLVMTFGSAAVLAVPVCGRVWLGYGHEGGHGVRSARRAHLRCFLCLRIVS